MTTRSSNPEPGTLAKWPGFSIAVSATFDWPEDADAQDAFAWTTYAGPIDGGGAYPMAHRTRGYAPTLEAALAQAEAHLDHRA